jgi:hypothetical protein
MKKLPAQVEYLSGHMRNIIALDPMVSIRKMQGIIEEKTGQSLSDKYVSKLMHKIRRQAVVQSDRKQINERLAEVKERYRVLMEDLLRTIYWKGDYFTMYRADRPTFNQRLAAIRLLAQMELALFKAEIEVGMFENRKMAMEEMLREGLLPTELHEQIVGVFRTWKIRPREVQVL